MRHERDRGIERHERLLEPLERLDVEMVRRLVEEQQVGAARERARERRTGQLAAREGRQPALELLLAEAEPARHLGRPVAPQIPPVVFELGLSAGVAVERRGVRRPVGHRRLELRQARFERQLGRASRQQVFAQATPRSRGGR